MPAVVWDYIANQTFEGSLNTQRQLLADYREDVRKYASGVDQTRILNVFEHIPVQLAKNNKKFQISKVAPNARFKDYRGCIEWLHDAGIINICYCLSFPELPLKGNYESTKYKIYMKDTGLLVAMLDEEAQDDLRVNKNLGVYKGALYENIVAEALVKSGYDLYYYKKRTPHWKKISSSEQKQSCPHRSKINQQQIKITAYPDQQQNLSRYPVWHKIDSRKHRLHRTNFDLSLLLYVPAQRILTNINWQSIRHRCIDRHR